MSNITILGSGGWGTALAIMADHHGNKVVLWSPFEHEINQLKTERENRKLLPGNRISDSIILTNDDKCVKGCDLLILAVPSFAIRNTLERVKPHITDDTIIVNVSKGIEDSTLLRLSELIKLETPNNKIVVLSGPSHAEEVAKGYIPTTVVAASESIDAAEQVQNILSNKNFRIYTNDDIIGVELGGALKNIIALAAGICNGLKLGDNTKAALITRGLTEISRLGVAMGAKRETFAGLSGVGDLIVTCISEHSRNRRCGILIGEGIPAAKAVEQIGMTVEGVPATKTAYKLSKKYHVDMPIVAQCHKILFEGKDPKESIFELMTRPVCNESENFYDN